MKRGDEIVVYIRGMKVAGIYKVTREYFYDSTRKWKGNMFPQRIGFSPTEKVPSSLMDIRPMFYEYPANDYKEIEKGFPKRIFWYGYSSVIPRRIRSLKKKL